MTTRDLKPISTVAIPHALAKAEKYRLLNDPQDAESICRDILRADPDNQEAMIIMILALTDQFGKGLQVNISHAQKLLPRVDDEYARTYYAGIIFERWAKTQRVLAPGYVVYDWFGQAMDCFEQAERLSPAGNEDACLRYNACARMIRRNPDLRPRPEDAQAMDAILQDDVPC